MVKQLKTTQASSIGQILQRQMKLKLNSTRLQIICYLRFGIDHFVLILLMIVTMLADQV